MKILAKRLLGFTIILTGILYSLVGPIDRTALEDQEFFKNMKALLDQFKFDQPQKHLLYSSWKKIAITPDHPMSMAGYRLRDDFETVHDSLYARIVALRTGEQSIYMISLDLLLFPPTLKQKLDDHFKNKDLPPFLYLSATHTHNGVGCWHDSTVGNLVLGSYDEKWVDVTKNKIISAIEDIESNLKPSSISYWEVDAREFVENRLASDAPYDGMLRGLKLTRSDDAMSHLITFSAHATSISKKSNSLSGDYPAAVIDTLMNSTHSFGMFMAGMVGSHRLTGINTMDFDLVAQAGKALSDKIQSASPSPARDSISLTTAHIPIQFGPSQLRISKDWKVRDWVFSWLVNPLQGELTYLQINDVVLIGTPCDFSGEIFVRHIAEVAAQQNKKVIITSFNGDYTGYITEDEHYESSEKEEVMTMNWVGPYYGSYFTEIITDILKKN